MLCPIATKILDMLILRALLQDNEKTLAMWAMEGKGPPSVLVGGRRFYFKDALDAFIRGEAAA